MATKTDNRRTMLPPPPLSTANKPRYGGGVRGFAEVKPHNVREIIEGLKYIRERQARTPYPQAFLITYRHDPQDLAPRTVTPYLLVPHTGALAPAITGPGRTSVVTWLGSLGNWFALSPVPLVLPAHPEPRWGRDVGPAGRGSMVEPLIRYAFFRFSDYKRARDLTAGKQPEQPGADVAWKEIAEYLYELASELGPVDAGRAWPAVR
ncbi:hypothetical protein [Cellulomonas sp. S1-8]|uniref:hypothetical protein n=1 Tax=Cellulomonas sp. S1-8 TaxID=2904790 RepID=UPI0022443804|nr:hypothetical protein [Cellulomonas sp. S1-8]UZN03468.1 hypothetical protein OKX07_00540 [Cellulomonas sp. S1-8]